MRSPPRMVGVTGLGLSEASVGEARLLFMLSRGKGIMTVEPSHKEKTIGYTGLCLQYYMLTN